MIDTSILKPKPKRMSLNSPILHSKAFSQSSQKHYWAREEVCI